MSAVATHNPYQGMTPFAEPDAERFFGRKRWCHRLLDRLRDERRVLFLVGPSGCGKTSLLLAGALPLLRREQAEASQLLTLYVGHPSVDVFGQLSRQGLREPAEDLLFSLHEAATAQKAEQVLLICDHLEELLTLQPSAQRRFTEALQTLLVADSSLRLKIVLVARGDCVSALTAQCPLLLPLLDDSACHLPAGLEVAEWTAMVQEPARSRGVSVSDELLDAVGRDLSDYLQSPAELRRSEAVLVLLSAALWRMWALLGGSRTVLTAADYQRSGGIRGAVTQLCESAWHELPMRQQPLARRLLTELLQVVSLTGGSLLLPRPRLESELLRPVPVAGVTGPEDESTGKLRLQNALSALLDARLLLRSDSGDTIELASGVMLSEWRELARWPEEDRRFASWHRELEAQAQRDSHRPSIPGASLPGIHLAGGKLAEAEHWLAERGPQVDPKVARYVAASVAHRERRLHIAATPVTIRPRRRLLWSLLAVVAVLLGLMGWQGQRERMRNEQRAAELEVERGARAALLVQQPGQDGAALALAISAAAPSLRSGRKTPPLAKEGLMITYSTAKNSLPLHGHSDRIEQVMFDPSGQRVLTGSQDQTARVWDARTGEQLTKLSGHKGFLTTAVFSPDGARVLTTSTDHTARLWDSRSGQQELVLSGHADTIEMGAFSAHGDRVVTASQDQTARVWDTRGGRQQLVLTGHSERVTVAAFDPRERLILTASFDKTVRLWDAMTGSLLRVLSGHEDRVNLAAFSPDGERVVTGSWDTTARLWTLPKETASASEPAAVVILPHGSRLHAVQFSPDGALIATAGTDGVVKLWDGKTGALRARFLGHSGTVDGLGFAADSSHLVSAGRDRTVRLWDVRTEQNIAVFRGHSGEIYAAAFAPNGTQVVTASFDRTARIWDVRAGTPLAILQGHTQPIAGAVFSPDGTRIATASYDYTARLWKWPGGDELAVLTGHRHRVNCVTFSLDGKQIATGSSDGDIRIWDGQNGKPVRVLTGHQAAVFALAFHADGKRIVSGGADGQLRLWDTQAGKELRVISERSSALAWVEFSPDQRLLASAWTDGTTILHDGETFAPLRELPHNGATITSAVFQQRGDVLRLITTSDDRTVRIWDARTGKLLDSMQTFAESVAQAAVVPQGSRVIILGKDSTVRLWDLQADMPLAVLPSFDDELTTVAYAPPDGRYFLIGSANGTTRIYVDDYPANLAGTLTDACNRLRHQPEFAEVKEHCP